MSGEQPMSRRPTSVTVIAWALLITGALGFVGSVLTSGDQAAKEVMARSPIPIPVQYAMLYGGLAVSILCGIAIHSGQNWARFLYVIWGTVGALIGGLATSPTKLLMMPGLVFFLIVACFLFSPRANSYFTATKG